MGSDSAVIIEMISPWLAFLKCGIGNRSTRENSAYRRRRSRRSAVRPLVVLMWNFSPLFTTTSDRNSRQMMTRKVDWETAKGISASPSTARL